MTAHDLLVREAYHCPWCGGEKYGECPEPDGMEEVPDYWRMTQ